MKFEIKRQDWNLRHEKAGQAIRKNEKAGSIIVLIFSVYIKKNNWTMYFLLRNHTKGKKKYIWNIKLLSYLTYFASVLYSKFLPDFASFTKAVARARS